MCFVPPSPRPSPARAGEGEECGPYNPGVATRTRHAANVAPRLSVIVLVYNEVESVAPLHEELMGMLDALDMSYEVLYIDDGSRDGSTERLGQFASRDAHVRVVSFRRNFGHTAAVQAGNSKTPGGDLGFIEPPRQNHPPHPPPPPPNNRTRTTLTDA